jgi:hypothetical protein
MTKKKNIYVYIIVGATILCVLVNYVNNIFLEDYTDPVEVGRKFAYSFMIKDPFHMKTWSIPAIHKNIDLLSYRDKSGNEDTDYYNYFNLVASRRIGDTLICTYALMLEDVIPIPAYSVILKPYGPLTILEKIKKYIYLNFIYATRIMDWPVATNRWIVFDFLPRNDFDFEQYATKDIAEDIDENILEGKIERMGKFEKAWSDKEMEKQNREIVEIYNSYFEVK